MVLNSLNSIFVHLILLTRSENLELKTLKLQEFLNNSFNFICCCLFVNYNLIGIKVLQNSGFIVSELVINYNFQKKHTYLMKTAGGYEFKDHSDQVRAISE